MGSNDNWQDTDQAAIAATGLAPSDPRESALIATLSPAAYTVIESGVSSSQGIALIEVYDIDPDSASSLVNISTRAVVQSGDSVMIGGIIVSGTSAGQFVVRALGPSLAAAHISDPLPNPALQIFDAHGNVIASNDDWRESQQTELQSSGLAPSDDHESAILRFLSPGSYTAIVRSVNSSVTGVALIEFYRL